MSGSTTFDIWRLLSLPREDAETEVRERCRTVYLGGNEALTRILGRYKMYVDTRDVGISGNLMMDGYWELWVTEAMMRHLRRGAVVADVGANLGYFTLLMADLTGAEGHVMAFEPNPELTRRLGKSIDINGFSGFTKLYRCGLGSAEGWADLDVVAHQPGGGKIVPLAQAQAQAQDSGADGAPSAGAPSTGTVQIRRFDDLPRAAEVEFMKIDVEGFERDVLAGMTARLENYDLPLTIFMEFTICRFDDARGFLHEITNWGFSLEVITHREGVQAVTPDQLFDLPHGIDHMLILRRSAPQP